MGRPPIEIDKKDFEKLCGLHCTKTEIASWFECSEDTIERWCKATYENTFAAIYQQKKHRGAISIRRKQMEVAMNGNIAMLIFLGKQYLGQSDKVTTTEITLPKSKYKEVDL